MDEGYGCSPCRRNGRNVLIPVSLGNWGRGLGKFGYEWGVGHGVGDAFSRGRRYVCRKSKALWEESKSYLPGGVNSPVRSFKAVGGHPLFIKRGEGPYIYDEDGNKYIDYVCSWGALILGHAHPEIVNALIDAIRNGTSFGACTALEVEMAKRMAHAIPSCERIRFVNSGTEAAMTAVRVARGYTRRRLILKFDGCYHGHSDALLTRAGSGMATYGIPASEGVTEDTAKCTISLPFNDISSLEEAFRLHGEEIACAIVEPVPANMGVVLPWGKFLKTLRRLCSDYGSLLIFDEVITGFRLGYGGAQRILGVIPDISCFGKIIGGGLPVGAVGGRREILEMLAPLGPVYQAGTLSGNPLAMTAGLRTLEVLNVCEQLPPGTNAPATFRDGALGDGTLDSGAAGDGTLGGGEDAVFESPYRELDEKAEVLARGIREAANEAGVPVIVNRIGSMFTVFFSETEVRDYVGAKKCDTKAYARFFKALLKCGVYFPPSQFEACFVSTAHSADDVEKTIEACRLALQAVRVSRE